MEAFERLISGIRAAVWEFGIPAGEQQIPLVVIALLGTGIFLTLRLAFVQIRHLGHGFAVATGKYDDPDEPGDVSHFQALTTALSATVGIGNIAGVAIAIHWGGPGALFWMWVTAFLGMATKYCEVTLAQKYRDVEDSQDAVVGTVSGGPMYYIERGLGSSWKPLAVVFAIMLGSTAFLTGNAIQANTVADTVQTQFGIPGWITGLIVASVVAAVILGGISRIGKVTGVLAPAMASVYVLGALLILVFNFDRLIPSFLLIFTEAFNPSAGVAGTGIGAILVTMMWGVNRGLFSNEAGQGSAPIAHAAAKTDEPVSEGVVALTEPFIDTIIICSMTALVIIMTGVFDDTRPTEITLAPGSGDGGYVAMVDGRRSEPGAPSQIRVTNGVQEVAAGAPALAWHDVPLRDPLFTDAGMTQLFTGTISPSAGTATSVDGTTFTSLYANAVESGAPLTMMGFRQGLARLGDWGHYIVLLSAILFGISTAISWSYYGDRCANYLFGAKAIVPYKMVYVVMTFLGAVVSLSVAWDIGDIFLGIVILPNLIGLILLSGQVKSMTDSYFERKPWIQNAEDHKRAVQAKRQAG